MRLLRIEAGQFGRIGGRVLDGLSPELTVVLGPNEAGKSSFTALVRYVLYGFPTAGDKNESPYLPQAGKREARLVFGDESGEWAIERTEGVRGGAVAVRALRGTPREGLVGELTTGVSRNAYRVVLGFGLSDLAQLEELKGQDGDLLARLYAAGAGINVSPIDVRATFDASKEALWKKGGSAPVLNRAKSDRDAVRRRIRDLEGEAEALRAQAARLEAAERELEAARAARTATQAEAERTSAALAAADRLRETAEEAGSREAALRRDAEAARATVAAGAPDAAALAAADAIDGIARELSGFRGLLENVATEQERLRDLDARLEATVAETGWSLDRARAAAADAGAGIELESFRERITRARAVVETAATRDAVRMSASVPQAAPAARGWLVPAIVMGVLGIAALAWGVVSSQLVFAGFGAVLLLAAAAVAFTGRSSAAGGQAPATAHPAGTEREAAEADLARVVAEWGAWASARGLGEAGDDPAAVAARYQAARAVRDTDIQRASASSALERAREAASVFAARAVEVCAPLVGDVPSPLPLERVPELVDRAVRSVAGAQAAARSLAEAVQQAEQLEREAAEAGRLRADALARAGSALAEVVPDGDLAAARQADVGARASAQDARDSFDRLNDEVSSLRTKVGAERRDTELAELHLDEESLNERIAAGVRDYAVLALAGHLLGAAQERYERDRQPEVVKHAEAAFASMTNERYPRLTVPLGKDAIEVFDRAGTSVVPARLSRGTAEQLYLALRIGLIDQLGEVGASLPVLMDDVLVNFSPDRVEPAARAIVELARRRQVVFFTCHPATADLLCTMDPGAARLEIERPA